MRGNFLFGSKLRLFKEWSKLTVILIIGVSSGCNGLTFTDETKGELKLVLTGENITKVVVRDFPDSNSFMLSITRSNGTVVYNGKYGEKPANLQLEAGSYDVNIYSRLFVNPEFDAACYSDSKTVVIQSGKVNILSLTCRQSNVGLRLSFTSDFKSRYVNYLPEIADSKGMIVYPYSETRFAYLNAGNISVRLKEVLPAGSTATAVIIPISDKVVAARDMITINLHANPDETSSSKTGIVIDTTSNWLYEYIVVGGGGDGSTKEKAFIVDQLVQKVGATGVWVTGYIVGGDLTASGINFVAPFVSVSNIAIAASSTTRDRTKCASVALPTGTIRDLLNLNANPTNLGKRVYLKGTIVASYFGLTGLNPLTEAQF